jgi:hypothetical protein
MVPAVPLLMVTPLQGQIPQQSLLRKESLYRVGGSSLSPLLPKPDSPALSLILEREGMKNISSNAENS